MIRDYLQSVKVYGWRLLEVAQMLGGKGYAGHECGGDNASRGALSLSVLALWVWLCDLPQLFEHRRTVQV